MSVAQIAPLDYRSALDAVAFPHDVAASAATICNLPELQSELELRSVSVACSRLSSRGIWIEPLADTLEQDLVRLSSMLPVGATLHVIASRPMARLLPERRAWDGSAIGLSLTGQQRIVRALSAAGFQIRTTHGFHGITSILFNLSASLAGRLGRPMLADRLRFSARMYYCNEGLLSAFSTVALLTAEKRQAAGWKGGNNAT